MNTKQFEQDFENLIEKKDRLIKLLDQQNKNELIKEYQDWFTESCEIIKTLIPDRTSEFEGIYYKEEDGIKYIFERRHFLNLALENQYSNSNVIDFSFRDNQYLYDVLKNNLEQQFAILESARRSLKSSLMNIKTLTQADLFDSELEMAEELNKNGFLRPAGVLAGVVLESHLKILLSHRNIDLKKSKSLAEYNELLKKNKIIDIPVWRNIQFLTDIRNKCCHSKEKEPTVQDVSDLIDGVKKIIKTVY